MRRALLVALALTLPAARADLVVLKDGREVEGVVEEQGDTIVIARRLGALRVPREDVVRIERREAPEQELARRVLALKPGDHAAALALGQFCLAHGFEEEARALAAHVQAQAPLTDGLQELWLGLDHHLVDGAWVAPEVYYPARGWERVQGRWTPPEEVRVLRASRAKRDAERAIDAARAALAHAERADAAAGEAQVAAEAETARVERHGQTLDLLLRRAEDELRLREDDVRFAEEAALDARRRHDGWVVVLHRGDRGWETQRALLLGACARCDRELERARRAREAALGAARELSHEVARIPERLEAAHVDLRRANGAADAARAALAAARTALAAAEAHLGRVEQELTDARAAREAARRGG